jgi:hypothetical protein
VSVADYSSELDAAERAARLGGAAILRHYARGADVRIEI